MRVVNRQPVPDSVGIFGSNNHIGLEVAREIARISPSTKLRLFIRLESYRADLEAEFPGAEIMVCNYFDESALIEGFTGLQGLFIVTPDFLDEERAMNNIVHAARVARGLLHIVRIVADPPGMDIERVPHALLDFGMGVANQHIAAKEILVRSRLPVTYLNVASWYFQNWIRMLAPTIISERVFSMPRDRRMGFIDSKDVAACAAHILMSDNHRYIGHTFHLNNNHDVMLFSEVADLMSEALGEEIRHDGSDEYYLKHYGDGLAEFLHHPKAAEYLLNYMQFEQDNEVIWYRSDVVEQLTGRPATKFRDWLVENKELVLNGPQ